MILSSKFKTNVGWFQYLFTFISTAIERLENFRIFWLKLQTTFGIFSLT